MKRMAPISAVSAALCMVLLLAQHSVCAAAGGEAAPGLPTAARQDQRDGAGGPATVKKTVLTLGQCIDQALGKNPGIVAARFSVESGKNRVGQARAAYYPQLSAQAGYSRIKPSSNRLDVASVGGSNTFEQYSSSVNLSQKILDFGNTSRQVDAAEFNLESSQSDLTATEDGIILSVKEAYYGVLQARRNRDVATDVLKQFQLHLDQAKGFYEVGTKAKIDVIKAEVDLSNAKLSLIRADNALKIAWVTLKNTMGVPDAPDDAYVIEEQLSFEKYAVEPEEATIRAFKNRADLRSLAARRLAAETSVGLARTGHYPVLSGSAKYTWSGETSSMPDRGWTAGVVLTVPLFSGFLTDHQVAEAKSNLAVLKANEETLRQQVIFEVRQAYLNLQAAEASIATAELATRQAQENLDLANGRYAAGVGSPIEVSDALATYVTAEANYTNALSDYKIARAAIEKAMGER